MTAYEHVMQREILMTNSTSSEMQATAATGNLWQKGFIAAVVATVINLIIFVIGSLAGGLAAQDMANPTVYTPVPWFMVIIMTIIPILLGTAVYWLLRRVLPNQATLILIVGALAVALLSMWGPITSGETLLAKILLSVMHIVAGVSLIWFMTR